MGYGTTPKVLPATGVAMIGGGIAGQLMTVIIVIAVVYALALAIRYMWRHNKSIGE